MKRETLFLKAAVIVLALPVLAVCIFALPQLAIDIPNYRTDVAYAVTGLLVVLYATALIFFAALWQAFRLLNRIDRNDAFSEGSVSDLKKIKLFAILIGLFYTAGLLPVYVLAEIDDAPGLIVVGMGMVFASFTVAVFAAVLEKLLRNAIDIKSENDLTV
ncbi:DUF2975 domain-containing protein [Edaphobacillus lindanitolerans]|uniref:DUF2975 domain-containing protein n=1 Tax=Edaphobacillus lindanitolerans TaxID=550447 RepID=A0A1U7PS06_9BACI|nr:DUF2975 domain-containing protein [Edaphobacillus lindanitolerans]SIT88270.1 Protein of unknown function [Edaphobacillus lindanitolerans]